MARITYPDPAGNPASFDFGPDSGEVLLGRHPQCTVVVKDSSVSRQHARIVVEDGAFRLEDLGSANGIFQGEERVTRLDLAGRVEFLLGEVPIIFEAEAPPMDSPASEPAAPAPKARKPRAAEPPPGDTRVGVEEKEVKPSRAATERTLEEQLRRREAELAQAQTRLGDGKMELRKAQGELTREKERTREVEKELAKAQDEARRLREELEESAANLDDTLARVRELEGQIEDFVRKESEHADELSNLRIEVVHKDRQMQELRKALELAESAHHQMREEMRTLEDRFREDTRVQSDLERRLAELREVIDEKENHVRDLRRALDEKDHEVRQAKLGVGMSDLEEERRKLLEDFYAANKELRRLEALGGEAAQREREREEEMAGLRARVRQLQRAVEEQRDISAHPDFRARLRDIERLEGELRDARAAIVDLTRRLKDADAPRAERHDASPAAESGALASGLASLGDSLEVLRTALKDVEKGLEILIAVDPASLPDKEQRKLKRANPAKALEGVRDAMAVVEGDRSKLVAATKGAEEG